MAHMVYPELYQASTFFLYSNTKSFSINIYFKLSNFKREKDRGEFYISEKEKEKENHKIYGGRRASGYTTFLVKGLSLFVKILILETEVHLESATYKVPSPNTGVSKSTPTYLTDWPCALLIVIANASWMGN